jgi:hypothetical protein
MPLTWRMELYRSRVKSLVGVVRALSIFSLQDEANLTGFMRVLTESKPAWHECFGNANPVKLAPAKLVAEAMHSFCRAHSFYYGMIRGDANTNLRRRDSYTLMAQARN